MHQDGLVHISEIADKFVANPNDVLKTGQIVKVRVLEVDQKRKRVGLSMKSEHKAAVKSNAPAKQRVETKPTGALADAFAKLRSRE